jgi:Protein of unknown function (DUF805)
LVIMGLINLVLTIGRFHDIGLSGWWTLLTFIPIVNLFVLLFLLLWPSTQVIPDAAAKAMMTQGDRVMHHRLGMGTIVGTAGPFADVKFDDKTSVRRVRMEQLQIR